MSEEDVKTGADLALAIGLEEEVERRVLGIIEDVVASYPKDPASALMLSARYLLETRIRELVEHHMSAHLQPRVEGYIDRRVDERLGVKRSNHDRYGAYSTDTTYRW